MNKILLIEDDAGLCELLTELLQLEGFQIESRNDGKSGLEAALSGAHDMVLLDVMLPKLNGFEVLKQLRQTSSIPVLMLTAKGDDIDRVVGLEIGADDYLPKPFNDRELIARIRAILRRSSKTNDNQETITCDDIRLYPGRHEAWADKQQLELTSTEYTLLEQLVSAKGELVTKEHLSQHVLGKRLMPFDRALDMHLSNLRRKLPSRSDERPRIKTVRGKGYIWIN